MDENVFPDASLHDSCMLHATPMVRVMHSQQHACAPDHHTIWSCQPQLFLLRPAAEHMYIVSLRYVAEMLSAWLGAASQAHCKQCNVLRNNRIQLPHQTCYNTPVTPRQLILIVQQPSSHCSDLNLPAQPTIYLNSHAGLRACMTATN